MFTPLTFVCHILQHINSQTLIISQSDQQIDTFSRYINLMVCFHNRAWHYTFSYVKHSNLMFICFSEHQVSEFESNLERRSVGYCVLVSCYIVFATSALYTAGGASSANNKQVNRYTGRQVYRLVFMCWRASRKPSRTFSQLHRCKASICPGGSQMFSLERMKTLVCFINKQTC